MWGRAGCGVGLDFRPILVAAADRYCPAMARLSRFFVPDTPQHVIQRGNNRQAIFGSPADLAFFKDCLMHAARRNGVAIHA